MAKCISLIVGDDKKLEAIKIATNPEFFAKGFNVKKSDSGSSAASLKKGLVDSLESLSFSSLSIDLVKEKSWQAEASLTSDHVKFRINAPFPKALKASLQEYSDHRNLILHRYPSYYLPDVDVGGLELPTPSAQLERQLSQFYTLNSPLDSNFSVQSHLEASRYAVFDPPFIEGEPNSSVELPKSLLEAEDLFRKYLWESRSYIQII